MSTLQLSLAVLGALLLAALGLHGWWQARQRGVRQVPVAAEPAPAQREPTFDDTVTEERSADAVPPRTEPTLARRATARVDALIDAIATISVDTPVSGETVLAHAPASRRAGSKPLLVEGLNAANGSWETPALGQRYGELQVGVQLANRAGALNEIEYSEFAQKVQALAEGLGALADLPDMLDAVARARELDAFAGEHDAQLAMRLMARGAAWSPGYVQQHAAREGFVPGALPGRLILPAGEEGAPPVLSLQFDPQAALAEEPGQAALREVTLSFDVPQTAPDASPFAAWCAAGGALAAALDATPYDDNGQPLPPQAFPAIGASLEQLYAALAARDLAAGSMAARRLFS
ncbi:MAG TPA: cell division protein FtsZ [Methylibium sp.]|nr:cell division protein FtsZ [Methylibium sp.]